MSYTKRANKAAALAFIKGHVWADRRRGHQGEQHFVLFADDHYAILCPYPVVAGKREPRVDRPETWLNVPEVELEGILELLTPRADQVVSVEPDIDAEDAAAE